MLSYKVPETNTAGVVVENFLERGQRINDNAFDSRIIFYSL